MSPDSPLAAVLVLIAVSLLAAVYVAWCRWDRRHVAGPRVRPLPDTWHAPEPDEWHRAERERDLPGGWR